MQVSRPISRVLLLRHLLCCQRLNRNCLDLVCPLMLRQGKTTDVLVPAAILTNIIRAWYNGVTLPLPNVFRPTLTYDFCGVERKTTRDTVVTPPESDVQEYENGKEAQTPNGSAS